MSNPLINLAIGLSLAGFCGLAIYSAPPSSPQTEYQGDPQFMVVCVSGGKPLLQVEAHEVFINNGAIGWRAERERSKPISWSTADCVSFKKVPIRYTEPAVPTRGLMRTTPQTIP